MERHFDGVNYNEKACDEKNYKERKEYPGNTRFEIFEFNCEIRSV
jgi:hypothetical protein